MSLNFASLKGREITTTTGLVLFGVLLALFLAAFLSLQAGVWALLFVLIAWYVWLRPTEGFLLFLVVAPLLPMLKITQTIGTITLLKDVIILTLFMRLFAYPLLTKTLAYRRNILFFPIVALVGWVAINVLRADSLTLGVLRARDIVLYMLLYFVVLYLPQTKKFYRQALTWVAATAVIVVLLAGYQWFWAPDSTVLRFDPVREIWIPRISSVLAHPSILGHYLFIVAGLFAAVAVFARRSAVRLGLGALAILTVPLAFLTYSRAVWLGYAAMITVMVAVYLWSRVRSRAGTLPRRWIVGGTVTLLIILLLALRFTSAGVFVRSAFDPTYASNEERLIFLSRLIAPLSAPQALLGQGLGDVLAQNFREVTVTGADIAAGAAREVQLAKDRTLVDNQYIKTLVELGLAGLLIYLWIYWRLAKASVSLVVSPVRISSDEQVSEERIANMVGLWTIGFLAAFLLQGLFIDVWDIFPTNAAFWIVAALVSKHAVSHRLKL